MPLASTPSALDHWRDPTQPIPLDARAQFTELTQHRQALADYITSAYIRRDTVHVRRATIAFLRAAGVFHPTQRWTRQSHFTVLDYFGARCILFLKHATTVTLDEAIARLRAFREPQDPTYAVLLPDSVPDTTNDALPPPVLATYTEELTPAALRSVIRATQRENRTSFISFLLTRRGACNPARVYRQWCLTYATGTDSAGTVTRGLRPYRRTAHDANDRLGPDAARLILDTPKIDRTILASQLEKI